jgi:hypothetical protein
MTTDPYNDCSDIFVGLDSGGGPVSPHMVIYLRCSVVVPARWLVALPPPPCAPPPLPPSALMSFIHPSNLLKSQCLKVVQLSLNRAIGPQIENRGPCL